MFDIISVSKQILFELGNSTWLKFKPVKAIALLSFIDLLLGVGHIYFTVSDGVYYFIPEADNIILLSVCVLLNITRILASIIFIYSTMTNDVTKALNTAKAWYNINLLLLIISVLRLPYLFKDFGHYIAVNVGMIREFRYLIEDSVYILVAICFLRFVTPYIDDLKQKVFREK
ncbi:unnamed protein product [Orchesella dallaii]